MELVSFSIRDQMDDDVRRLSEQGWLPSGVGFAISIVAALGWTSINHLELHDVSNNYPTMWVIKSYSKTDIVITPVIPQIFP